MIDVLVLIAVCLGFTEELHCIYPYISLGSNVFLRYMQNPTVALKADEKAGPACNLQELKWVRFRFWCFLKLD